MNNGFKMLCISYVTATAAAIYLRIALVAIGTLFGPSIQNLVTEECHEDHPFSPRRDWFALDRYLAAVESSVCAWDFLQFAGTNLQSLFSQSINSIQCKPFILSFEDCLKGERAVNVRKSPLLGRTHS